MNILNVAAYKFIGIPDREKLQPILQEKCEQLKLKGTILLADEGINLTLAGGEAPVRAFLSYLATDEIFAHRFNDLEIKESFSEHQPFGKMVVRMPKEIITMRHPMIRPESGRAATIEPKTLKKWLAQGHDDGGREVVLLDTRNNYEVKVGTFEGAIDFDIVNFSQFPECVQESLAKEENPLKEKTIVTFCTGGIRCEKAALYMNELNLPNVYQLHGGILNYFEQVGGDHWNGECFVFDERVAVDPQLKPTKHDYGKQAEKIYRSPAVDK
ncbi:MAG: sulfurtransferase [Candidatus Melainabacteria bacterium]|nr:MAG: sulfurtransferase [Candidatus Melainabacteria bacterium]